MTHPFQVPYATRDAAALLAATKLHLPLTVADADEVRNTDLSGQFGGLRVSTLNAFFKIDTEDTQEDNGIDVIIDLAGNHFVRSVELNAPTSATYGDADVSGGSITIAPDVQFAFIDTTSQVNVVWPLAADRVGLPLTVTDEGGFGFVPVMSGSDTLNGGAGSIYAVTTPNGFIATVPRTGNYAVVGSQL